MAKQLTKRQRRAAIQAEHIKNGGLIQVSFTFGGKKHQESHRLTASEIQGQMEALKRFGLSAIEDSTLCLVAIASGRLLGQHVITEAFKDFIRENWKPAEDEPTAQEVVDEIAKRRGIDLPKRREHEQLDAAMNEAFNGSVAAILQEPEFAAISSTNSEKPE